MLTFTRDLSPINTSRFWKWSSRSCSGTTAFRLTYNNKKRTNFTMNSKNIYWTFLGVMARLTCCSKISKLSSDFNLKKISKNNQITKVDATCKPQSISKNSASENQCRKKLFPFYSLFPTLIKMN